MNFAAYCGASFSDSARNRAARSFTISWPRCPGIRAADERGGDDQKRTMTLAEAFRAGADHIVVGRPIRHAADPRAAAEAMQTEIARLFAPPR